MFNHDWFHGSAFQQQIDEAKRRCTLQHFPDADPQTADDSGEMTSYRAELESRTLIYLRDGFSYEVKDLADLPNKSHLVFECEPVDDQYKAGTFIVTVPFEEIVRVEAFCYHPTEKPDDMPQITGFRSSGEPHDVKQAEVKPAPPGR